MININNFSQKFTIHKSSHEAPLDLRVAYHGIHQITGNTYLKTGHVSGHVKQISRHLPENYFPALGRLILGRPGWLQCSNMVIKEPYTIQSTPESYLTTHTSELKTSWTVPRHLVRELCLSLTSGHLWAPLNTCVFTSALTNSLFICSDRFWPPLPPRPPLTAFDHLWPPLTASDRLWPSRWPSLKPAAGPWQPADGWMVALMEFFFQELIVCPPSITD